MTVSVDVFEGTKAHSLAIGNMPLRLMSLTILPRDAEGSYAKCHYAKCRYAKCRGTVFEKGGEVERHFLN
jgi:hypothetical protein